MKMSTLLKVGAGVVLTAGAAVGAKLFLGGRSDVDEETETGEDEDQDQEEQTPAEV